MPVAASGAPPSPPIVGAETGTAGGAHAHTTADGGVAASDGDEDDDEIDDGFETPHAEATAEAKEPAGSPILKLTDREIEERLRRDPVSLGPMSVGSANAGALVNGVQMPKSERWVLLDPASAWGTRETIDALTRSIDKVHEQIPASPKLYIGHISAKRGGHLSPHVSHQSGRDVDISYFLSQPRAGFIRATADNLDLQRTWAFVKALIIETDVEMILIDTSIQKLLGEHAARLGEDPAWLDSVFQTRAKHPRPLVRHAKGHANHIHIRFFNPVAQEIGRRAYPFLLKDKQVAPSSTAFVLHRARSGDTIGSLARRYGTTVEAIRQANGLKSNAIKAKHTYRIPKKAGVSVKASGPVAVPARRSPPGSKAAGASR